MSLELKESPARGGGKFGGIGRRHN